MFPNAVNTIVGGMLPVDPSRINTPVAMVPDVMTPHPSPVVVVVTM